MSTFKPIVNLNSVTLKGQNRKITIFKALDKETKNVIHGKNFIHIKALTLEVGTEPGVQHLLSCNNKVKESMIGLTDDALLELYTALHIHFKTLEERTRSINKQENP